METGLSTVDQLRLGLSKTYYSVARALKIRKLRDLLRSAHIAADAAVWLLGDVYGDEQLNTLEEEALTQLWLHFQSIIWMTYRTQFTSIVAGEVHLNSDAGWGCTLRSGQMILAQALQRHWLGKNWRWPLTQQHWEDGSGGSSSLSSSMYGGGIALSEQEPPAELCRLLQLFWDAPSERNPLSIHNLCSHGRPCGVHPGKWLGPWVMCHALAKTAAASQQLLGLRVAVLAEPGGGAPILRTHSFEAHFTESNAGGRADAQPWMDAERGEPVEALPQGLGSKQGEQEPGLLLLVPLVLGLGKLNPVYIPQLQAVLRFPQSVGIVGGRPSSSLYFVGYQGGSVFYLDPHEMQPAACNDGDWLSFHCDAPRTMPLLSIDPSLALGFYCRDVEEYRDLCERLRELEAQSGGAPLLSVTHAADVATLYHSFTESQWVPDEMSEEGEGGEEEGEGGCVVVGGSGAGDQRVQLPGVSTDDGDGKEGHEEEGTRVRCDREVLEGVLVSKPSLPSCEGVCSSKEAQQGGDSRAAAGATIEEEAGVLVLREEVGGGAQWNSSRLREPSQHASDDAAVGQQAGQMRNVGAQRAQHAQQQQEQQHGGGSAAAESAQDGDAEQCHSSAGGMTATHDVRWWQEAGGHTAAMLSPSARQSSGKGGWELL